MGRTFVSTLFSSGAAFETWIKGVQDREGAWDKKACLLDVVGDKLRLLDKDNNVLAEVDYCKTDNETITVDSSTGVITAVGLKEKNSGKIFSVWIGTQAEYDAITTKEETTWYCITDDNTLTEINTKITNILSRLTTAETNITTNKNDIANLKERATEIESSVSGVKETAETTESRVDRIMDGTTPVPKATYATNAVNCLPLEARVLKIENGTTSVPKATNANHATSADSATNANHATSADSATNAGNATKVNNLEITQDENGVLKIGDIIIPQKKLLWSGKVNIGTDDLYDLVTVCDTSIDNELYDGNKFYEIVISMTNANGDIATSQAVKVRKHYDDSTDCFCILENVTVVPKADNSVLLDYVLVRKVWFTCLDGIRLGAQNTGFYSNNTYSHTACDNVYVTAIYEIIE